MCPICGKDKRFDEFSEEHAPPRGGQSALGPATTIVLTCRNCNTSAGDTFESDAAERERLDTAADLPSHLSCDVHGGPRIRETVSGVHAFVDEKPVVVTDLKAAFILAFASLGYSWAASQQLRAVRGAIQRGEPSEPRHAWSGNFELSASTSIDGNAVLEVGGPYPCVIVRAVSGTGVVLPVPGSPNVAPSLGEISVRSYPWPKTLTQGHFVGQEYLAGNLFHADFCRTHQWPSSGSSNAPRSGLSSS